tara:strand:- start:3557 stop:3877 length:321 start_codon:yes stop_codon:yes gene_type:complete
MDDFDVEIQDEKQSNPEHFNGVVTTAGSPVTITPTSGENVQLVLVKNPNKGPNKNNPNDVLLVSIDGGTTYVSLSRGEYAYFPGIFTSVKIDSTANGAKYESIVWS